MYLVWLSFTKDSLPKNLTVCMHGQHVASLLGFVYICEKAFSTININKSKLRSRLTDDHLYAVLLAATNTKPKHMVSESSQLHKSHSTKKLGIGPFKFHSPRPNIMYLYIIYTTFFNLICFFFNTGQTNYSY